MERGIGTSRGIGIGHVLIVYNASAVVNRGTHYNAEEEKKRFFEARKTFIEQTEELLSELEKKLGESDKDALVLKNQIYLARDITTENEVVAAIDNSHICAEAAFDDVCNKLIQLFSSMDNTDMQQRVTDIQDMRERMIQILQGTKAFDLTNLPDNTVIVADEIKPSMTASMDIAHVAGIVAEKGGDTAHASILARALEIPAVLSVKGILQKVKNGDSIIIDGAYGEVFINPTQRTFSIYEKKKKKYEEHIEELKTFINKSTETADGKKVMLAANIGGADEAAKAPADMKMKDMTGMPGYKFSMAISALDCTGCGSCANVCPGKKGAKALAMENMEANAGLQKFFDYGRELPIKEDVVAKFKETTVKGSQFKQPLLEFSGACAGCGETPYAKLITQLFGDRMYIANATGCSSIWGNSSPSTPYTTNAKGQGPAWANSLFEDNAEFGYGMLLAQRAIRDGLKAKVEAVVAEGKDEAVKEAGQEWLDTFSVGATNGAATDKLIAALEACGCDAAKEILAQKNYLSKKSQWIFGGDGWAYDIGFGGVDHVLASGKDINVMVFDTEVYSNTGGQASKSTPVGSVAQFAAAGKSVKKKDLASIMMSYGYVYVAQVAMGADMNQCLKAMHEAESYHGPSIVIAYAPCINHGIKGGMGVSMNEEKKAVAAGYWHTFRFDPRRADNGENPFQLDSKKPSASYRDFIMGEVRYNSLTRAFPQRAEQLFEKAEKYAEEKYEKFAHMASEEE